MTQDTGQDIGAGQTGKIVAITHATQAKLTKRERQRAVLDLRLQGRTYREIAGELGMSSSQAHRLADEALADFVAEPAEQVRKLELARLDRLYSVAAPAAERGDMMALAACLKVQERRAKLLGLDSAEGFTKPMPEGVVQITFGNGPPEEQAIMDAIMVVHRWGDMDLHARLHRFRERIQAEGKLNPPPKIPDEI
jgi:transposase-like protein